MQEKVKSIKLPDPAQELPEMKHDPQWENELEKVMLHLTNELTEVCVANDTKLAELQSKLT